MLEKLQEEQSALLDNERSKMKEWESGQEERERKVGGEEENLIDAFMICRRDTFLVQISYRNTTFIWCRYNSFFLKF